MESNSLSKKKVLAEKPRPKGKSQKHLLPEQIATLPGPKLILVAIVDIIKKDDKLNTNVES